MGVRERKRALVWVCMWAAGFFNYDEAHCKHFAIEVDVGEKAFCCCELLKYTEGKAIIMHKRNIQLSFNAGSKMSINTPFRSRELPTATTFFMATAKGG